MPPVLARKRLQSDSPAPEPPPPKRPRASKPSPRHTKESVFQTLDAAPKVKCTLAQTRAFLEQDDQDSELSEPGSSEEDFEHVPLNGAIKGKATAQEEGDDGEESVDDDWEDALGGQHHDHGPTPVITGGISLTLSAAPKTAFDTSARPDGRKGPSKRQRQVRNATHCMHVQFLMFHNFIRNAWIQDEEVQKTLVERLSSACWSEVDRYWRHVGVADGASRAVAKRRDPPASKTPPSQATGKKGKWAESGRKGVQIYESPQSQRLLAQEDRKNMSKPKGKDQAKIDRSARDWGAASEPLEPGIPNLSAGDPLMRLLRYLSAYWKSKFRITAPSLRKRGYLSPATLEDEINAWKQAASHADTFGERIESLDAFREVARSCEGSRDVGEQLFTALLRGLGIESRMVVSLQPVGFGFSQAEEGKPKNLAKAKDAVKETVDTPAKATPSSGKLPQRAATRGQKKPLDGDLSDHSDLSSVISISSDTDKDKPVKKTPKRRDYSEELPFPTYWTEAISHLTHTPISVSPFPRLLIASASSPDKLHDFYARGAAADKARQVLAYLVAFSSDGSAKDVTTRYLPKHQWPGRTKGFRMAAEKIPIYNKRGKVKGWEEWDWFKSVMRSYARAHSERQPWDEVEDEGDLVPVEPNKKRDMDEEGGKESLQGYKNSAEYVLERHLRREEALKPNAKVVRQFVTGKGEKEKSEPVYRRRDIVNCKTVESWHKEGREVKEGEQPLKYVPMRAVTVTRKREIEERERDEGVKPKQGLYSHAQTEWIIPPPIENGIIPRNAFNNIDIYVPTMIPKGAVHIPLKGTARICRKLNIEHAEACTGFEFGKQRAVPVLTGVVVAAENEQMVIDAWEVEEQEKARKEAAKREKMVLGLWKKFLSGLRIIDRMKAEYGDQVELPFKSTPPPNEKKKSEWEVFQNHGDFEGGFLREDAPYTDVPMPAQEEQDQDQDQEEEEQEEHGTLTIDNGDMDSHKLQKPTKDSSHHIPKSLISTFQKENLTPSPSHTPLPANSPLNTPTPQNLNKNQNQKRKHSPSNEPADKHTVSTRSRLKRQAAAKSEERVRSHFFVEEKGGGVEMEMETDLEDRVALRKGRRGRGRGRGEGC